MEPLTVQPHDLCITYIKTIWENKVANRGSKTPQPYFEKNQDHLSNKVYNIIRKVSSK